jgi:hypothetical protein
MSETAGWIPDELPAAEHLRTVAEILSAPPSPEERRALRREQAEAEAKRARAQDSGDSAAAAAFIARVTGTPPRDVLAEAAAEPFRDREAHARRRAAIEVLRPLGLEDVLTGGSSGVIFDANMGVIEPEPDVAQRAAMDFDYETRRSAERAEEGRRFVEDIKTRRRAAQRPVAIRSASHPGGSPFGGSGGSPFPRVSTHQELAQLGYGESSPGGCPPCSGCHYVICRCG